MSPGNSSLKNSVPNSGSGTMVLMRPVTDIPREVNDHSAACKGNDDPCIRLRDIPDESRRIL